MTARPLAAVIAEGLAPAGEHRLERRLFGSADPRIIAGIVRESVAEVLGDEVVAGLASHTSVGATFGAVLGSGDRVAVKFLRPERCGHIDASRAVQRATCESGLPVPRPLTDPSRWGESVVVIDEWLDPGPPDDPASARTRNAMAGSLVALLDAARPLVGRVDLPSALATADGSAYGEPHDLRFDFDASARGAEWIDDLNQDARAVLAAHPDDTIGHVDFRGGNVVVVDGAVAAIYDWDSVALTSEPAIVGMTSANWSLAWEWGSGVHPDLASMEAFVADVERARGTRFDPDERSVVRAAQLSLLCYSARCEHSDRELGVIPGDDRPFARTLRQLASTDRDPR